MKLYVLPPAFGFQTSYKAYKSQMAVEVTDQEIKTVHISGTQPEFYKMMCAMLADDAIREVVSDYQKIDESCSTLYKVEAKEGVSGALDVFLCNTYKKGGLNLIKKRYLCHISAYDKLQDEVMNLSIRQFIELACWTGINGKTKEQLVHESGVRYINKLMTTDKYYNTASKLCI